MRRFRFIHCADLHLDSPFQGLLSVSPVVRDRMKEAALAALDRLVDLAVRERVAFVLFCGDVYDAADRSIRAQIRFQRALERLEREGIGAYVIWGNHDPADGYRAVLNWPKNVTVLGTESVETFVASDGEGNVLAEISGYSYPTARVTDNVSLRYPSDSIHPGAFRIGMLHANVGGSKEHGNYAPCSTGDLLKAGMDYWALGHIHQRAVLHEQPWIVYPGNLQGRHAKETGEKGCYVVEVSEDRTAELRFEALDSVRWERLVVEIDELETEQDLVEALEVAWEGLAAKLNGRSAFVRVSVQGRGRLHDVVTRPGWADDWLSGLREEAAGRLESDGGEAFLWPERIELDTEPAWDWAELKQADHFLGELLRMGEALPMASGAPGDLGGLVGALPEWMKEALGPLTDHPKVASLLEELPAEEATRWAKRAEKQAASRLSCIAEGIGDAN